jgi:hypothetical protein
MRTLFIFCIHLCNWIDPKSNLSNHQICSVGQIYGKLVSFYKANGGKCTADSAFAAKNVNYIIRSLASVEIEAKDRIALHNRLLINKEATAMQKSAEWGMHALKTSFPRLKDLYIYE